MKEGRRTFGIKMMICLWFCSDNFDHLFVFKESNRVTGGLDRWTAPQNLATNPLTVAQNTKSIMKLQHERESDLVSRHTLKL